MPAAAPTRSGSTQLLRCTRADRQRLPGLDLLRALAVLGIMLYHVSSYGPRLPTFIEYGYIAVDLFFVLSGFLVGRQLLLPYAVGAQPTWRQFFLRRAFRILPAYLVVLAAYKLFPPMRESPAIAPLWQFLTFTKNMFVDYQYTRTFSHAWSLCIEEHFYLLLPLTVYVMSLRPSAARVIALALALVVGGMWLRHWLWQHEVAPFLHLVTGPGNFFERYIAAIYSPTYARLDGLLAGVMLAVINICRPAWWNWAIARRAWFCAAGVLAVTAATQFASPGHVSAVVSFPLLSVGFAAIVLACASPHHWLSTLPVPGVGAIAAISFSLYLAHKPAYTLVRSFFGTELNGSAWALPAYCVAAMLAGCMLYGVVERPAIALRRRIWADR